MNKDVAISVFEVVSSPLWVASSDGQKVCTYSSAIRRCQVLEPAIFDYMPACRAFSTIYDLSPRLIRNGQALFGVQHPGTWMVIDDAVGVAQAAETVASDHLASLVSVRR